MRATSFLLRTPRRSVTHAAASAPLPALSSPEEASAEGAVGGKQAGLVGARMNQTPRRPEARICRCLPTPPGRGADLAVAEGRPGGR